LLSQVLRKNQVINIEYSNQRIQADKRVNWATKTDGQTDRQTDKQTDLGAGQFVQQISF